MANPVASVFVLGVVLFSSEGQYNVKQWGYPQAKGLPNPWVRWPMQRNQWMNPNSRWSNPNYRGNNVNYRGNNVNYRLGNLNNQWNGQQQWQPPWPTPYTSTTEATTGYEITPTPPTKDDYNDANVPIQRDGDSGSYESDENEDDEAAVFLKKDMSFRPEIGYDPYWPNGSRIFDVQFFQKSTNDTHRLCGELCHVMYSKYGPICGRNKDGHKRNFKDYCELVNYDCDGYDNWIAAYRGSCQHWLKPAVLQPTVGVRDAANYIKEYSQRYTTTTTKPTNYETDNSTCDPEVDPDCSDGDNPNGRFFF